MISIKIHRRYVALDLVLMVMVSVLNSRIEHWVDTTPGGNWVAGAVFAAWAMTAWWITMRAVTLKEDGDEPDQDRA